MWVLNPLMEMPRLFLGGLVRRLWAWRSSSLLPVFALETYSTRLPCALASSSLIREFPVPVGSGRARGVSPVDHAGPSAAVPGLLVKQSDGFLSRVGIGRIEYEQSQNTNSDRERIEPQFFICY